MSSRDWYRDNFLVSTSPKLLQPDAINLMCWCTAMAMKQMLDKPLCFGLYALPKTSAELAGQRTPPQTGLARAITDEVTFAYLADVYVLDEYQHQGLGKRLIDCVNETVDWESRSHKQNDRDHAGLSDGTVAPSEHLPKFFGKSGHADADPKKSKKNGAGKGGWGVSGEEIEDTQGFTMANARRRSNSSSYASGLKDFKTKFEQIEADPVFEEDIHGPSAEETADFKRVMTTDSEESNSVDEEDKARKM